MLEFPSRVKIVMVKFGSSSIGQNRRGEKKGKKKTDQPAAKGKKRNRKRKTKTTKKIRI